MKIDKVIFSSSTSSEYSPFWNLQSELFLTKLGIEPICLLFGKKAETDMHERYGKIIEMEADPALPWALQLVWSKFNFPTSEPDTTWLIGDIDLVPLQHRHFIEKIANIPDTGYAHLNSGGISQPRLGFPEGFLSVGSERHLKDLGQTSGADLPGHYHVAKGRQFEVLTQKRAFLDQIRHIVESDRYGMGVMGNWPKEKRQTDAYWYYWCAEENYSSELILNAIRTNTLDFFPVYYNNNNGTERIDRSLFTNDYVYDPGMVQNHQIVDVHCARPYSHQKEALERLVKLAWDRPN
jgi:hypothetical protein